MHNPCCIIYLQTKEQTGKLSRVCSMQACAHGRPLTGSKPSTLALVAPAELSGQICDSGHDICNTTKCRRQTHLSLKGFHMHIQHVVFSVHHLNNRSISCSLQFLQLWQCYQSKAIYLATVLHLEGYVTLLQSIQSAVNHCRASSCSRSFLHLHRLSQL